MSKLVYLLCVAFFVSVVSTMDYDKVFQSEQQESLEEIETAIKNAVDITQSIENESTETISTSFNQTYDYFKDISNKFGSVVDKIKDASENTDVSKCLLQTEETLKEVNRCLNDTCSCATEEITSYREDADEFVLEGNTLKKELNIIKTAAINCVGTSNLPAIRSLEGIVCVLKNRYGALLKKVIFDITNKYNRSNLNAAIIGCGQKANCQIHFQTQAVQSCLSTAESNSKTITNVLGG